MAKIICKLPNASANINGFEFEPHVEGVISKEITDQAAIDGFLAIPGYVLDGPPPEEAEKAALIARATEFGVRVDARWKMARLKLEVQAAEDEKAAAANAGNGSGGDQPPAP